MNFTEAQGKLASLKQRFAAGHVTAEEFSAQLAQLRVQDKDGSWWQLGQDGVWFFWNGASWETRVPPIVSPPPLAPPPLSVSQPHVAGPASSPLPSDAPPISGKQSPQSGRVPPKTLVQLISFLIPSMIKAWLKNIPLMIGLSVLTVVVHTYLLIFVNNGFSKVSNPMLGEILVLTSNFAPGILFWTFLSGICTTLAIMVLRMGFSRVKSDISMAPAWVRRCVSQSGASSMIIVLGCASGALVMGAALNNRLVSLQMCVMLMLSMMSRHQGLMAVTMPLAWSDAHRLFNRPHAGVFNSGWVGTCLFGALAGFGAAVVLPFSPYLDMLGAIILGGIAIKAHLNQKNGPSVGMFIFIPFITVFFAWMAKNVSADDGGWSESGSNFSGWLNNPGASRAIGIGIPPAVAVNVGVAAGVAIADGTPSGTTPEPPPAGSPPDIEYTYPDGKRTVLVYNPEYGGYINQLTGGLVNPSDIEGWKQKNLENQQRVDDFRERNAELDATHQDAQSQALAAIEAKTKATADAAAEKEVSDNRRREQLAKDNERLENERLAADRELNSAGSLASDTVGNILTDGRNIVKETAEDGYGLVKDGVTGTAEAVKDLIKNPSLITETAGNIDKEMTGAWDDTKKAVSDAANEATEVVGDVIKDPSILTDTLGGSVSDVAKTATGAAQDAWQTAKDGKDAANDVLRDPNILIDTAKGMGSDVVDMGDKAAQNVHDQFVDRDKRNKFIGDTTGFNDAKDALDPSKSLGQRLGSVASAVSTGYKLAGGPMEAFAEGASDAIKDNVKDAIGDVNPAAKKIIEHYENAKDILDKTEEGSDALKPDEPSNVKGSKKYELGDHLDDMMDQAEKAQKVADALTAAGESGDALGGTLGGRPSIPEDPDKV